MDFREHEMDFGEADRRYAELKRQHDAGTIRDDEFDEQLKQLMVQDDEGRWWAKSRGTGEWHYHDGASWVRGTPPGPKPSLPGDEAFVEDLMRVCAKYEGFNNYHVGEAIPQKKLANARSNFLIPDTERVVALLDTSNWGSGKTGLAICENGIRWRNISTRRNRPGSTSLQWDELAVVPINYSGGLLRELANRGGLVKSLNIEIGGANVRIPHSSQVESIVQLLHEVQSLVKTSLTTT